MDMTGDWHPAWTYEWFRDIGVPLLSAIASITVGIAAVFVARRSNRIARETTEFARTVHAAEEARIAREEQRRRQQERVEFAVFAREYAELHSRRVRGLDAEFNDFDLRIAQAITTLTDQDDGKYLLERIRRHFGPVKFPPDGSRRDSPTPLGVEVAMTMQAVRVEITAYIEHRPMSKPHWREQFTVNPNRPD